MKQSRRLFATFQDTIYSLSTGWGKSAIAVIRISGPNAKIAANLTKPSTELRLKPRFAYYKTFYDIFTPNKKPIDQGILLYFKSPNSFTGEDMMEFQIHGSHVTRRMLLDALAKIPQFRQALPVSHHLFKSVGRIHKTSSFQWQIRLATG